ncbi:MAG: hypothetical protein ACREU6_15515, partial [Steroidobacteraceae bacterium]
AFAELLFDLAQCSDERLFAVLFHLVFPGVSVGGASFIISQEISVGTLAAHDFQCYFSCFAAYPVPMN